MTTTGHEPSAARFRVTARYAEMEEARDGVRRLEEAGFSTNTISLEGGPVEAARTRGATDARDRQFGSFAARTGLTGFAIGAAVGALLGLLLAVVIMETSGVALLGTAAGGAGLGGGLGLMFAFIGRVKQSEEFELTYEPGVDHKGDVTVSLRTDDEDEAARAEDALRGTEPLSLERV